MKQHKEIAFDWIKWRMKSLKINLKKEADKHGIKYITITTALNKRLDLKASQLIFLAEILQCDSIDDLFREVK